MIIIYFKKLRRKKKEGRKEGEIILNYLYHLEG